jgi:serine/threonine protein kinase
LTIRQNKHQVKLKSSELSKTQRKMDEEDLIPYTKGIIFLSKKDPSIIIKKFITADDDSKQKFKHETTLQNLASKYVKTSKIIATHTTCEASYIIMEKIKGDTIFDFYGYDPPKEVWDKIYHIIIALYQNNIYYIDITPFNFLINDDGEVFVIDFEHASPHNRDNWFLQEFIDGSRAWNPDFA